MSYPTAPKVQAASVTAAVSGALLWILQHYIFKGTVPDGVASLIYAAVPGALAFAAGWATPHQDRPREPVVAYLADGKAFHPDDVTVVRSLPLPDVPVTVTPVTPPAGNVTVRQPEPGGM